MALDMFFKNLDIELIVDWLTTSQIRAVIGDIRAFDGNEDLILDKLSQIPGQVNDKIFPANSIVLIPAVLDQDGDIITPAVMDPNAWVQLRLTNDAELFDFSGTLDPEVDLDRWKHSKTVTLSSANAVESVVDGVTQWEKTAGPHSGVIIQRGSEMQTTGSMFHEYLGGNNF